MPESPESEQLLRKPGRWTAVPSLREVLLMAAVTGIVFVSTIELFHPFLATVHNFGDNGFFTEIASAIRSWDFHGLVIKAFWGLSYVMAGVSLLTHLSAQSALLLVSYSAGLATIILGYRLWGGWVAAFFILLNFDWIQRLFLGGSESLFTALMFGSFLAARKERWLLAALLAAYGTTVRPLGLFALVGIGVVLLLRRNFLLCLGATLTGLLVGGLYLLPFALYFQNPLANMHSYQREDWESGRLLTWPLYAIVKGTFLDRVPATSLILTWGWILFVLAGFLALILTKSSREYWRTRPAEMIFALLYLIFIYTYNSPRWARGTFPRFAIPIVPFVLVALYQWLPKDRRLLWALAVVSPILAASSALGIRNVAAIVRHRIG